MTIDEILHHKGSRVVSMWMDHTLADAIRTCDEHNISSVVVTDHQERPIGILSDRDALRALARRGVRAMDEPVTRFMQAPLPTCRPADHAGDVLHMMTLHRRRHVVVMEGGRMAGLVSVGDLAKAKLRDADLESRVLRERALSRLAAE